MDIESTVTIRCGMLSATADILVRRLARKLGAEICCDRHSYTGIQSFPTALGEPLSHLITITLTTNLQVADERIISQQTVSLLELESLKEGGYDHYVFYIRECLASQQSEFIRKEILESLTPPPPYNDTGALFIDQPIFLKSTGNRQRDKALAKQFSKTAEAISILQKNKMI